MSVIAPFAGLTLVTSVALAQPDPGQLPGRDAVSAAPRCPVTNEPINLAVRTETEDGPVFFCCTDCVEKYRANPGKYTAKVAAQRAGLALRPKVQVTCPVTRDPVDTDVFVAQGDRKVYFCCKDCVGKFKQNPAKYRAGLANAYTYQTKCPVMGDDIDPASFATLAGGQKVYFCCNGCEKKLLSNPGKYLPNLAGQGFGLQAADIRLAGQTSKGDKGHAGHAEHDHDHDH